MGRPRKPIAPPPPRDPFAAWGDVPTDQRAEVERLASIVTRDGRCIADFQAFSEELGAACHEANWALYERTRINPSTVVAELEDLQQKAAALREALGSLGGDAKENLNNTVALRGRNPSKDSPWSHLEPRELTLFPPSWDERAEWLGRALADCEGLVKTASNAIVTPASGRPPDQVVMDLVRRLGEIWQVQTGRAPTLTTDPYTREKKGDFLEFCEEVITPIWRARELAPPSVKDFVKRLLYSPR